MNYEEEVILEHFDTPDSFELELHISYKDSAVKVTCIDKTNNFGSAIDGRVSKWGSVMGTVVSTIIENIKATIEVKK